MYTISKEFSFSASHQLNGLDPEHPCGRLHGHNYRVELELASAKLDEIGFVVDYGRLADFEAVLDGLDHQHLNDQVPYNPTAEHLARGLFEIACRMIDMGGEKVIAVRVSETPKTWAEYRGELSEASSAR